MKKETKRRFVEDDLIIERQIRSDYNKADDILSCCWEQSDSSLEFFDGRLILDFNKKGDVVGFEFFDFKEALRKAIKQNNDIFKIMDKKRKNKK